MYNEFTMATLSDPSDNTYWLLLQFSVRVKHDLTKLAEAHDLTVMQMYTLCSMEPGVATPMNSISMAMACDASNVTGIIDRLLSRSLIHREEKPEDRRVKMISLTQKGRALREKLFRELDEYETVEFKHLTAAQRGELRNLLDKVL
jgi:DNA-binding MarR family transcriptional regulator